MTSDQKSLFKNEVANYLKEQVLSDVGRARSPVTGRNFVGLNKDYKKIKSKVSGSTRANLKLFGDMLDNLDVREYRDGIDIGHFGDDDEQVKKADNHNKFSAKSRKTSLVRRPYIPKKDENYRKGIIDTIEEMRQEILDSGE